MGRWAVFDTFTNERIEELGTYDTEEEASHHADMVRDDAGREGWAYAAELEKPDQPEAHVRIAAFAGALGLTLDHLVALLESYDLHIVGGKYLPTDTEIYRQR